MSGHLRGIRGFVAGAVMASVIGVGGLAVVRAATGSSLASSYVPVTPQRVVDTRSDLGLVSLVDGVEQDLTVVGSLVPMGATAVSLTVTAVEAGAAGFVSVRAGDAAGDPSTSSLNVDQGDTIANSIVVALPTSGDDIGKIKIVFDAIGATSATTDVLVDVIGYYELASAGPVGPAGADGRDGVDGSNGSGGGGDAGGINQQSVCDGTDVDKLANELCKIGMTGPGGGTIFFVDDNSEYSDFDYLEMAPAGWGDGIPANPLQYEVQGTTTLDPIMKWCYEYYTNFRISGLPHEVVGAGARNTATADIGCSLGAIQAAVDYSGGGKEDWFLGSIGEMMLLSLVPDLRLGFSHQGNNSWANYWSSTEYNSEGALFQNFNLDTQSGSDKREDGKSVRPIRAF